MRDVHAGRLGCPEQIARLRQLQRPAHGIDGARVFKGQVVGVVGDHQEARRRAPAGVVEPKKKHARRIRDRPLLGVGPVFAFRVAVNVGNGSDPRIAHMNAYTEVATFAKVGV